jgi:hypothetical protein
VLMQPDTRSMATVASQIIQNREAGVRLGAPQYDQTTGEIRYPQVNGRGETVGFTPGGKPTITVRDTVDADGNKIREKGFTPPGGQFIATDRSEITDRKGDAQDAASLKIATGDRDTLNTEHHDVIQKSLDTYDRMAKVRQDVMDGKGVWGTGASLRQKAYNALVSMGFNFNNKLSDSLNTDADFMRVMKEGVATTIKNFNGAQNVSNTDLKFAQDVMQATTENNPEAVINALNNGMKDIRENTARYNVNATRHNSDLSEFGTAARRLKVPVVDKDFDTGERDYQAQMAARRAAKSDTPQASAAPAQQAPAEGARVVVRDPKTGKLRFQ